MITVRVFLESLQIVTYRDVLLLLLSLSVFCMCFFKYSYNFTLSLSYILCIYLT